MKSIRSGFLIMLLIAFVFAIAACSSGTSKKEDSKSDDTNTKQNEADKEEEEEDAEEPVTGGTLKIAIDAPPPTLDQPTSTATAARDASRLIFETLVTTNSKFEPIPMLAESIDTDDNKTFTFNLRQGVKFHNGKEMVAEDVVASMERWMEKSTITGNIFNGATWSAQDDYTVVLELVEASSLTLDTISSAKQAAAIMPKEIVESAPVEGVAEYIGTGPFKFVEWKQDQYIHYTKFEDYQPVDLPADGLSGNKEALVDDIYIYIVPDTSTRLAGLQTGEYHFAYGIPYDNYDQLQNDSNLETILTPSANELMGFNKSQGPAANFKLREVINTALNADEIMMAAFPNKDFYWLDPGYMDIEIANWASKAGGDKFNQNDPEKAKQMLDEMGYDGEEFRIMTTRDYDHHYNVGVVIHEQLKNIGLNAVLDVYDWPTLLDKRENDLGAWDAFITSSSTVSTPPQLIALSPTWAGGVQDDHIGDLMSKIELAPTLEDAQKLWDELQLYSYEELLPIVHLGGYHALYGHSVKVKGLTTNTGPIFWNVSVSE